MERSTRNRLNSTPCNRQINIINTMRKLWEQHSLWTRSTIISIVDELPDLPMVRARLLRNPTDFANALRPFYGRDRANRFEQLLRDHLVIAGQLVVNSKAGNMQAAAEDSRRWYDNADEIAAFLASINPYWTRQEWQAMLYEHLRLVAAEAAYRLDGQYQAGIMNYDAIEDQALRMADEMAEGIIQQFML